MPQVIRSRALALRQGWIWVLVLGLAVTVPAQVYAEAAPSPETTGDQEKDEKDEHLEYYELYKVLADTLDHVERDYVQDIDRRELIEAAIEGVIKKLDPYSNYIPPSQLSQFKTSVESEFGGIGIQITMDNGQLKVLSPLVGTPAYRAGLLAGDSIVEIEGQSTKGISLDEAVKKLKGKTGTSINITITHPGSDKKEKVDIEREVIQLDTVMGDHRDNKDAWDFMLDPKQKIGYIRISAFSRRTPDELEHALEQLKKAGMKGLVVDLRFNPGGLLTAAIKMCDMFISEGAIVSTEGRNSPKRSWEATAPGTYDGFRMAILVNRYSASASEIFSACLQDHHRAIVVGERTWGKGSVQNVIELEGGRSALKLTTASYMRPSGKNIHRFPNSKETDEWGVMPDEGYDLRLSDAELAQLVQLRRMRDIVRPHEGEDPEDEEPEDKQLQKALDYLSTELAKAS